MKSASVNNDAPTPLTTSRHELLRDGTDEAFRAFVHDLLAFGSRIRDIRDALGALSGLSGPTYTILISVAHLEAKREVAEREVNVSTVARHLSVSQPFVTAEVHKLVRSGLLAKRPSELDGRSVALTVTQAGRLRLMDLAPDQRDINDVLFESLDSADFDAMAASLSRLVVDADQALALSAHLVSASEQGERAG